MTIDKLTVGVEFKRCDECEYKRDASLRDDLLVTAGARAAYMHQAGKIELPEFVEGERELANFIAHIVDYWLVNERDNFDLFLEEQLQKEYGNGT
jgi:hypothetical protein